MVNVSRHVKVWIRCAKELLMCIPKDFPCDVTAKNYFSTLGWLTDKLTTSDFFTLVLNPHARKASDVERYVLKPNFLNFSLFFLISSVIVYNLLLSPISSISRMIKTSLTREPV